MTDIGGSSRPRVETRSDRDYGQARHYYWRCTACGAEGPERRSASRAGEEGGLHRCSELIPGD